MAGRARKLREKEERKKLKRRLREIKKAEYESKIVLGTNSKRKKIAARKGIGRLVSDHKNLPPYENGYLYVPRSRYNVAFW